MAIRDPQPILDELQTLMSDRNKWEKYWRDCNKYALPSTEEFDRIASNSMSAGMSYVTNSPVGYEKTVDLYDQTSLWAIERLTNGLISLKTPEATMWHSLGVGSVFDQYKPSHDTKVWMESVNATLFNVRANPMSGFWPNHKAGIRSVCAYGDGFIFVQELFGNKEAPWRYIYCPLSECYAGVDASGNLNRMFRLYTLTATQAAGEWPGMVSPTVLEMANDPKKRNMPVKILHAVRPRADVDKYARGDTVLAADWQSCILETETKHVIREGGYFEFPYIRHAWSRIGARPYCEGPMALALAEIKSLNELAKNELISAQQAVRPPLATHGDNYTRVNLNAGAVNQGLINGDGKMLVQPIVTHTRPDFAQAVLEARRNSVREMLYLNLWQLLIQNPQMTATEALLRNQEKGELLGPVGISFNDGLSRMCDREIGILARKGAFSPGAELEMPQELRDKDINPRFTSPLDKLRQSEQIVGIQRVLQLGGQLAAIDPTVTERFDVDAILEFGVEGFNAPEAMLRSKEDAAKRGEANQQAAAAAQQLELLKGGGEAAQEIGKGAQDLAGGTAAVQNTGPLQQIMDGLAN